MIQKYHFVHERGDYCYLAVEEISSVWTKSIKKTVGFNEFPAFFICKDAWVRIYTLEKRYQKIVDFVFKKISKDRNYVYKIRKIFDKRADAFLSFIEDIKRTNLKKLSNKDLIEIKDKYARFYHWTAPYGEPLPYFLKEKLQSILEEHFLKKKKISDKEFQILLTPLYRSFLNREAQDLLKIKKEGVKEHAEKYKWFLFDYASLVVDENFFLKRLKEFSKKPPQKIDYDALKRKKEEIIRKYKIKNTYKHYLFILEDLFYLMDKKKEVLTKCHFFITPLYKEAGRRLSMGLNDIRFFVWEEVKNALLNKKKINSKTAEERRKSSAVKYINGDPVWLSLEQTGILLSEVEKDEKSLLESPEVKGISASFGIIEGKIRYLKSAKENGKIKKGEVLLVSNTTPDFMPAIQKAKAIITNEGGITCHAAVISRELGIPCIVGTKIATKVLKEGDLVKVDANKGIVKVIKKLV